MQILQDDAMRTVQSGEFARNDDVTWSSLANLSYAIITCLIPTHNEARMTSSWRHFGWNHSRPSVQLH